MAKVLILIVDDSLVMRECLSELLAMEPDFDVIATAKDGLEAVEKTKALT